MPRRLAALGGAAASRGDDDAGRSPPPRPRPLGSGQLTRKQRGRSLPGPKGNRETGFGPLVPGEGGSRVACYLMLGAPWPQTGGTPNVGQVFRVLLPTCAILALGVWHGAGPSRLTTMLQLLRQLLGRFLPVRLKLVIRILEGSGGEDRRNRPGGSRR